MDLSSICANTQTNRANTYTGDELQFSTNYYAEIQDVKYFLGKLLVRQQNYRFWQIFAARENNEFKFEFMHETRMPPMNTWHNSKIFSAIAAFPEELLVEIRTGTKLKQFHNKLKKKREQYDYYQRQQKVVEPFKYGHVSSPKIVPSSPNRRTGGHQQRPIQQPKQRR